MVEGATPARLAICRRDIPCISSTLIRRRACLAWISDAGSERRQLCAMELRAYSCRRVKERQLWRPGSRQLLDAFMQTAELLQTTTGVNAVVRLTDSLRRTARDLGLFDLNTPLPPDRSSPARLLGG